MQHDALGLRFKTAFLTKCTCTFDDFHILIAWRSLVLNEKNACIHEMSAWTTCQLWIWRNYDVYQTALTHRNRQQFCARVLTLICTATYVRTLLKAPSARTSSVTLCLVWLCWLPSLSRGYSSVSASSCACGRRDLCGSCSVRPPSSSGACLHTWQIIGKHNFQCVQCIRELGWRYSHGTTCSYVRR